MRTKDVVGRTVGVTLSPFGLNEHALRSGVASESLVDKFVPFVLYLSSLGGIERLVLANELGIAFQHVLTFWVDIVEAAFWRIGKDGLGSVGGRDHDKAIVGNVESIECGNAQRGIVELLDKF